MSECAHGTTYCGTCDKSAPGRQLTCRCVEKHVCNELLDQVMEILDKHFEWIEMHAITETQMWTARAHDRIRALREKEK